MQSAGLLPPELETPLRRLKARCVAVSLLKGLGVGVLLFLCGAVLTGWIDFILPLPSDARLAAMVVLGIVLLCVVLVQVTAAMKRNTSSRLAGLLDRAGSTGGQIRAAVELAQTAPAGNATTRDLTQRAISDSARLADQPLEKAQPYKPAFRPYKMAAALCAPLVLAWLVWPQVVTVQAARVFDPRGAHLPPSPYTFAIKPSADAILFGDPFEVSVSVAGAFERERFEWQLEQEGRKPWRFPLIQRPDGTLLGSLSAVESDFKFTVHGPRGQSNVFAVRVINTPQIKLAQVKLDFPAYTGLTPFTGPIPEGGPAGVRGTKVTILLTSNRPLKDGRIELRGERAAAAAAPASEVSTETKAENENLKVAGDLPLQTVAMALADPQNLNVVAGTFEITSDLRFSAFVRDTDGLECKSPIQGRCIVVPDDKPRVALIEPLPRSYAIADVVLPVVIEAQDDFGISEVVLNRSVNGSRDMPMTVPFDPKIRRGMRLVVEMPLAEWQLEPGDVLSVWAQVRDNDPAGGKTAHTAVHTVSIITNEQYLAMMREQETIDDLEERYKPWLKKLVDLRREWQQAQAEKDEKKIKAVREVLREAIEKLEEQSKEPPVFSADLQFARELRELQETLRKAAEQIDKGEYDQVDNTLAGAEQDAAEDIQIPLELLVKMYRLIEDEQLYTAIAQVQRDIERRAEKFKDRAEVKEAQDLNDLRALQDEESEVMQALQKTLQDIRDHAGSLPKDDPEMKEFAESANQFATQVHELGVDAILEEARKAMQRGNGTEAHAKAKEAADRLMSLMQKAQEMAGQGGKKVGRRFGPSMEETINQLLGGKGLPQMGGQGGGRGGGFSMGSRGNSKTGLYGNQKKSKSGGGGGGKNNKQSGNGASGQALDEVKGFGMRTEFDKGDANAVPLTVLPSRYRSAVRDYYQRVADETLNKR